MVTLLLTLGLFGAAMSVMAIGVIVSDRSLRGSCGGGEIHDAHGDVIACGACSKKANDVCPTDEPLVALAQIAHPNPRHHR